MAPHKRGAADSFGNVGVDFTRQPLRDISAAMLRTLTAKHRWSILGLSNGGELLYMLTATAA